MKTTLRSIFDKTHGHCHFCGDALVFENRGWAALPNGHWEMDHVIQRHKGGSQRAENCLAACTRCNRLRWHRTGNAMRELLLLGTIALHQIQRRSPTGRILELLIQKRLAENKKRRVSRRTLRASAAAAN